MTESRATRLAVVFAAFLSNGLHAHALEPGYLRVAEISEDIGAAVLVTFFVVTISVFNQRPPSEGEIKM